MTISEFKKVARILKEVYKELEDDAIRGGVNLLSQEYTDIVDRARIAVLKKHGFTLNEYREVKDRLAGASKEALLSMIETAQKQIEEIKGIKYPTAEEIQAVVAKAAEEKTKAPQIIHNTTKEVIVKEPTIVKETVNNTIKVEYDEKPLQEKLSKLSKRVDEIQVPTPLDVEEMKKDLMQETRNTFGEMFEHNINVMGMPNFRKLAMGLREDLDATTSIMNRDAAVDRLFWFGDGSDGDVVITGDTNLARTMYYQNLTITNNAVLNPAGGIIYVSGTLTIDSGSIVDRSGGIGSNGVTTTGGGAGAAPTTNSSVDVGGAASNSGAGANGGATNGGAAGGVSVTTYGGGATTTGGSGGDSASGNGGGGGGIAGAQVKKEKRTLSNVILHGLGQHFGGISGRGGGGGAGNGAQSGGGGGGGGSAAGVIAIFARNIVNNGVIRANGGAGGDGANTPAANGAGGGGGSGGGGGVIYIVSETYTGTGSITALGGDGGLGGDGNGTGLPGDDGADADDGFIIRFNLLTGAISYT